MVLTRSLQCPTRVFSKGSYLETLRGLVQNRKWALVTSKGWRARGAVDALTSALGAPVAVVEDVPENPEVSDLLRLTPLIQDADELVALGGGSVIDCAKGLAAFDAIGRREDALMGHLRDGAALAFSDRPPRPIHAVPTTSGTGSEVTPWGTIWGENEVKFSVKDEALYPVSAILDPGLCVSMPRGLTVASGLDAMSHAMEAVWNNNHTPFSDEMARTAIAALWTALPDAVQAPDDAKVRARVQIAACVAGFAMGTTNTALCHSISYPFTARHGMPHGLACSFTLPQVAAYNLVENPARLSPIGEAMQCAVQDIPAVLETWMRALGIGDQLAAYVSATDADAFGDSLITPARAANNLRAADGDIARTIARDSLQSFLSTAGKS